MAVLNPIFVVSLLAFATLLCIAALNDFRDFKIPNRVSVGVLVLYPAFVLSAPVPVDWEAGVAAGGIAFAATFVMFSQGWLGGGDAKLISAVAVWAGLSQLMLFVIVMLVLGGVYSTFEAIRLGYPKRIWNRFTKTKTGEDSDAVRPRDAVPYGVAIAGGGLYVAMMQFLASA